jgi:hypothetical protein
MAERHLKDLLIEDFRGFKRLEVPRLGRVNLIVGKNNVGKTALLEALHLYASRGAQCVLADMILRRDEEAFLSARQRADRVLEWEEAIWSLRRGRPGPTERPHEEFPTDGRRLFSVGAANQERRFVTFLLKTEIIKHGSSRRYVLVLYWGREGKFGYVELNPDLDQAINAEIPSDASPFYFLPSQGLVSSAASQLWDEVVLAGQEEEVQRSLRVIDGRVKSVNLVEGYRLGPKGGGQGNDVAYEPVRVPVVRREGERTPVPLRSMGEGMGRLFGLSLSLAKAAGGMLMADEVENGLHYSVQPDVWRLIFKVAADLDVQVFATTHSLDCIRAFQAVSKEHAEEGVLVSLRRHTETNEVVAVTLDEEDLEIAVQGHIEIR